MSRLGEPSQRRLHGTMTSASGSSRWTTPPPIQPIISNPIHAAKAMHARTMRWSLLTGRDASTAFAVIRSER